MTESKVKTGRTRKPRGEYAKSESTRKAILVSALEVFAQSGYGAGSLREIAQRVGMSEAGLLHHFRSKGALLQAVLAHRDDLSSDLVNGIDSPDGAATLRGLVALAAHNAGNPGVVELYCKLSAEATAVSHPAHAYFVNRYESTRDRVWQAFDKLAREGRLTDGADPMRASITTIALMDGLQVQWLLNRSVVDMEAALADFFRSFVRGFDLGSIEQELDKRQMMANSSKRTGAGVSV